MLAVFQTITFDGWTTNLYNLMDSTNQPIAVIIFCSSIVFICSFFMLNLLLAVILERYTEVTALFVKMREEEIQNKIDLIK